MPYLIEKSILLQKDWSCNRLRNLRPENAMIVFNYIQAMRTETNLSDNFRRLNIFILSDLSKFHNDGDNKLFKQMSRKDILSYLDSFMVDYQMHDQYLDYDVRIVAAGFGVEMSVKMMAVVTMMIVRRKNEKQKRKRKSIQLHPV